MKRFTFRLQRLLELRSAVERDQARLLAEARMTEAERLADREASQDRLNGAALQAGAEQVTAGSLVNRDLALSRLAADAAAADAEHVKSVTATEAEQAKYSEAATARRAVEKLREHRLAAWNEQANRVEQHETDETAIRVSQRTRQANS